MILTGGLAAAPWARDVAGVDVIDPDLTLKGLAILHAEVAGGDPEGRAASRRSADDDVPLPFPSSRPSPLADGPGAEARP